VRCTGGARALGGGRGPGPTKEPGGTELRRATRPHIHIHMHIHIHIHIHQEQPHRAMGSTGHQQLQSAVHKVAQHPSEALTPVHKGRDVPGSAPYRPGGHHRATPSIQYLGVGMAQGGGAGAGCRGSRAALPQCAQTERYRPAPHWVSLAQTHLPASQRVWLKYKPPEVASAYQPARVVLGAAEAA
jgi:hypothetical protein